MRIINSFEDLPNKSDLQKNCKSIAVLDAIISQEWQYRYYSYNSKWNKLDKTEEFFEMRNGEGTEMQILFQENGCIINGFEIESVIEKPAKILKNVPVNFYAFMLEEPIKSVGTTFCVWKLGDNPWQTLKNNENNPEDTIDIFDGNPQTYADWATEYFEDSYKGTDIALQIVAKIYAGEVLTKEMVLSIVDEIEDWTQLKKDLIEINYPFDFS